MTKLILRKKRKKNIYGVNNTISELGLGESLPVRTTLSAQECLGLFEKNNTECFPVYDDKVQVYGIVTHRGLVNALTSMKIKLDDRIEKAVQKEFKKLSPQDSLKYLSKAFNRHQYVIIDSGDNKYYVCENKHLLKHYISNSNK